MYIKLYISSAISSSYPHPLQFSWQQNLHIQTGQKKKWQLSTQKETKISETSETTLPGKGKWVSSKSANRWELYILWNLSEATWLWLNILERLMFGIHSTCISFSIDWYKCLWERMIFSSWCFFIASILRAWILWKNLDEICWHPQSPMLPESSRIPSNEQPIHSNTPHNPPHPIWERKKQTHPSKITSSSKGVMIM